MTDGVDDEDEVLLALASSLGKMLEQVGGAMHAHNLLPPLELLLTVEENTVRDAASESAQTISESLPESIFQNQYSEMLSRLASKEWFTARMSSAPLIANAFPKFTQKQQYEFVTKYASLCQDDTPMVRRVAAQYLGQMVSNSVTAFGRQSLEENGEVTKSLIPLYEELASNEEPVRC